MEARTGRSSCRYLRAGHRILRTANRPLPWGSLNPHAISAIPINEGIDAIVMKALQRKPSMRFASAAQMREAIVRASNATSQQPSPLPFEQTTSKRSLAVPFSHESESGLVHAIGMVYSRQDSLQNRISLSRPSLRNREIRHSPREHTEGAIDRLHLVHGTFSSRLEIVADSIAALGNLPEAEVGCVQLRIAKKDRELAEQVVESLGFVVPEKARRLNQSDAKSEGTHDSRRAVVFCGIFNAGALAIGEIFVVRSFSQPSDQSDLAALSPYWNRLGSDRRLPNHRWLHPLHQASQVLYEGRAGRLHASIHPNLGLQLSLCHMGFIFLRLEKFHPFQNRHDQAGVRPP